MAKRYGLYNKALIPRYNKLVKAGLHEAIMKNLDDYIKHLETQKKKDYALMASTYINQERYKDEWEIVTTDYSQKWINEELEMSWASTEQIESIMIEKQKWEAKNKNKEITVWVFRNIITYYLK